MSRLESEPRRFAIKKEASVSLKSTREFQDATPRPQTSVIYPMELREQALADFDAAENGKDRIPIGILLQNSKILMQSGEYRLASHILIDILRRDSAQELAIRSLGECYYHLKEWAKAERILKISMELSPLTSTSLLYADVLYGLGKNEQALSIYNELLLDLSDEQDELFKVYKAIGNIYVRQGDLDSAEENYNKAFSIFPKSDVLLVNYGTLEIQRGQIQTALDRYREALLINDQNEKAWVGLALIHREYGDIELGWGNLHKALDLDPLNNTAIQLMADWSVKDHRISEVVSRLEKYLILNDQDADKSFLLAKLFYITGRRDLAQLEITRTLALNPQIDGGIEFFELVKADPSLNKESSAC